jgi:regulator of protease activity HflC (stomatin/prohibitin superfamily)
MEPLAIFIFVIVAVPMLAFLGWILWRRWTVVVPPRSAGLVIRRGRATDKTLPTGAHFTSPWNQTVEIYPDYEMAYMTLPLEVLGAEGPAAADSSGPRAQLAERRGRPSWTGGAADVDFADLPFGVIDREKVSGDIYYTLRFTIIRGELKQIHERFGAAGIKGIIRDESRRVIQETFAEDGYTLADLVGPSRTALEQILSERMKERLAANGFALVFLSLQEPDLRELGQSLRQQVTAREELVLEQLRLRVSEARANRLEAEAQFDATIEAERLRARAAAEADATILHARAEAAAEEERALRWASTAGKAEEIRAAKRLELAAGEAALRLKRAESIAQSSKVVTGDLTELLVKLETVERWREIMERWDGRMALLAAGPSGSPLLPPLEAPGQPPYGAARTGAEPENHPAPPRPAEVDGHGN